MRLEPDTDGAIAKLERKLIIERVWVAMGRDTLEGRQIGRHALDEIAIRNLRAEGRSTTTSSWTTHISTVTIRKVLGHPNMAFVQRVEKRGY